MPDSGSSNRNSTLGETFNQDLQETIDEAYEDLVGYIRNSHDHPKIMKKLRRNFTDEVIDMAYKLYESKHASGSGDNILRGERYKDRMNWYEPVNNPDENSRWGKLASILKTRDNWPQPNIDSLDVQSNNVVASLASPKSTTPDLVKGLVMGYVQSGKTANFSAAIAKATDEGYRMVIVLSGLHNGLRYQTEKRLRSELVDPHGARKSFTLTDVDKNGDFRGSTVDPNSLLNNEGKFVLAVLKKNKYPLRKFLAWLKGEEYNGTQYPGVSEEVMRDCPVLIIDDEADQASINDSRDPNKVSAINEAIRDIVNFCSQYSVCSYVGYTATPFANIFINAEEEDDLFPRDFMLKLDAPDVYVGSERLFGRASLDYDGGETGLNVIREIKIEDTISKDTEEDEPDSRIHESLKKAINCFLLAGAERCRRKQLGAHMTMLVNTSHLVAQHANMCGIVGTYLDNAKLNYDLEDDDFKTALENEWKSEFIATNRSDFPGEQLGSFTEVWDALGYFIKEVKIIKENGESDDRLTFENGPLKAIIVGGNTLSRGLTVEGLTITYFHRTSNGYDTLLQMGRWFGYRSGYLDLTRLFVTKEMELDFYHLATVEEELRNRIDLMIKNEQKPIDFAHIVRDHDRMNITNKQVLKRNGRIASSTLSGDKIQATRVFLDKKDIADQNFSVVQNLVRKIENEGKRVETGIAAYKRCLLYKKVSHTDVLEFLENYHFSSRDKKFNFGLLRDYITPLSKKGELINWSVVVMSTNTANEAKRVELGVNDLNVFGVERRVGRSGKTSSTDLGTLVNAITVNRDEFVDMADIDDDLLKKILFDSSYKKVPASARDKRPADRPLLMIYPLYCHHDKSDEEKKALVKDKNQPPLISSLDNVFGITVVFPVTRQETFEFNYVATIRTGNQDDEAA